MPEYQGVMLLMPDLDACIEMMYFIRFQAESDPYSLIHATFLLFDIKTIDKRKPQHIGNIRFDLCKMLGFHLTFVIVFTLNEKNLTLWRN